MLRRVGWDYLCDWISEEGLPKERPRIHYSPHKQGCVCGGVERPEPSADWTNKTHLKQPHTELSSPLDVCPMFDDGERTCAHRQCGEETHQTLGVLAF